MAKNGPGKDAGKINPLSVQLRPHHTLNERQYEVARFLLVRWRWSFAKIALRISQPEADVRLALRNLRIPRKDPPRYSINVGPEGYFKFQAYKLGNEPAWETFNRLVGL